MSRIPPLHCLEAFDVLARHKNGVRAAEQLCITPSALSHRIKQLESLLGTSLFETNGYVLTPVGSECLVLVRQALSTLQRLPEALAKNAKRRVKVAVTPTFARQLLMPKLPLFRLAYPDIELVLEVAVPLHASASNDTDLEIRFGAGGYTDKECTCILRDSVTPACSPEFLREHGPFGGFIDPEQLKRLALIRSALEPWSTWFNAFGLDLQEPSDGAQFNDVGMILEAAAAGYGVVLMRNALGQAWIDSGRLVKVSQAAVESPFQHYLCWRGGVLERWECTAFFEWLQAILD
jgi:LysR family transcriptional regulator, glycine cleavage system transcriptional activator